MGTMKKIIEDIIKDFIDDEKENGKSLPEYGGTAIWLKESLEEVAKAACDLANERTEEAGCICGACK